MRANRWPLFTVLSAVLLSAFLARARQEPTSSPGPLDARAIEQILGLSGSTVDGVFKVTKPRSDLRVTMDGFPIPPRMGLTGWLAFRPHAGGAMVMGDLPLLESELQPVLTALVEGGVEVSALHNHFVGEQPRVMFLHVGGMGDPLPLARGLRAALDAIDGLRASRGVPAPEPEVRSELDPEKLNAILGGTGDYKEGVYKVTLGRPGVRVAEMGVEVNAAMGFNSWAGLEGTREKAAIAGDLAMLAEEVNPVVRELRRAGIAVVAIHNHMIREEPRTFYLHYWGVGRAEDLARGLRAGLDRLSGGGR
ncbi:MAG TPA: DUF1259 domain-containing protein [Planctomycetota bacterium]|jgi:hypothetical protein|nr:DUF1259 domain-containing protein [Planctomycetota bacterium]